MMIKNIMPTVVDRTPTTQGPQLDADQRRILAGIVDRAESGHQVTTLGGLGGTGKSVIVVELSRLLPEFAVCAPTNKAAGVLRERGIDRAQTLSSLIHVPNIKVGTEEQVEEIARKLSVGERLTAEEERLCKPRFDGKGELPVMGVICDEASMIGKDEFLELASHGIPLIFTGDYGQLKPVKSSDPDFNLMKHLDYRLTKIYRNGGEIARFAEFVRGGGNPRDFKPTDDTVKIVRGDFQNVGADQVLTWTNRECLRLNQFLRWEMGRRDLVSVGDRLIMESTKPGRWIKSHRATVVGVVLTSKNPILEVRLDGDGHTFEATFDANFFSREKPEIQPPTMEAGAISVSQYRKGNFDQDCRALDLTPAVVHDSGSPTARRALVHNKYRSLAKVHHPDRGGDAKAFIVIHEAYQRMIAAMENMSFVRSGSVTLNPNYGIPARFAYCMTVHKAQASGFDHVAVYQDMPVRHLEFANWAYTAASRAISQLTWFVP